MMCRGVRGAITVATDDRSEVLLATGELLLVMAHVNGIDPDALASVFFTTTTDLVAEYPALAARKLGWLDVPLLCGHEMEVPGGMPRCIRVLLHWNTSKGQRDIQHIYLRDASVLRPDQIPLDDIPPIELPAGFDDLN